MAHAQMAAQSGRTPPATIAAQLKAMGMDPEMIAPQVDAEQEEHEQEDLLSQLSQDASRVLMASHRIAMEQGPEAGRAYLKNQIEKLSDDDQQIIKKAITL